MWNDMGAPGASYGLRGKNTFQSTLWRTWKSGSGGNIEC